MSFLYVLVLVVSLMRISASPMDFGKSATLEIESDEDFNSYHQRNTTVTNLDVKAPPLSTFGQSKLLLKEKSKLLNYNTKTMTDPELLLQTEFLENLGMYLYYKIVLPSLKATVPLDIQNFFENEIIDAGRFMHRKKRSTKSVNSSIYVSGETNSTSGQSNSKSSGNGTHYTGPSSNLWKEQNFRGDLLSQPGNGYYEGMNNGYYSNYYGQSQWDMNPQGGENNTLTAKLQKTVNDLTEAYKNESFGQRFLITTVLTILFFGGGLALLLWSPYILLIGIYGLRIILYVKDRNSGTMIS